MVDATLEYFCHAYILMCLLKIYIPSCKIINYSRYYLIKYDTLNKTMIVFHIDSIHYMVKRYKAIYAGGQWHGNLDNNKV